MRVKKLRNISNERVVLKFNDGIEISLPSGSEVYNVSVLDSSLDEVRDKVAVVADLGEINEHSNTQKLFD